MASIISAGTTSGTSLNLSGDTSGVLQLATNGSTTAITVDTSQNVGIGTASPAQKLHVTSSSSTYVQVQNTGNSVLAYYGVDTAGGWMGTGSNHYAAFYTNNTERMRIDTSGRVGINTTSPTTNLTIDTKALNYTDGINLVNSTSWGYGSSVNFVNIPTNGGSLTTVAQIQQYYQASNKYGLGLFTYDSSLGVSLTVNPNGNTVLKGGNQGATGVGITFPATQSASSDANCLDDYEEGTFTPTLITDGTATTPTYTSQNGRYVKIGSRVFIEAYLQWSSTSGGSGSVLIAGLPFTASGYSPDSRGFSYIFGWNGITFTGVLASVITASGTSAPLYSNNNGSIASLPLTSCSSGGALRFVFDYSAAN